MTEPIEHSTPARASNAPRWWARPLPLALLAGLLVLLAAFVPTAWQVLRGGAAPVAASTLQLETLAGGGVRAFGLSLPGSTLADATRRWGDELRVAVVARRGEAGALEAYLESYREGGITGRLVLATGADAAAVSSWRDRSPRRERVDADSERFGLHLDDVDAAMAAPVVGITFIPGAQLDAQTLRLRFGEPAERLAEPGAAAAEGAAGKAEHWLYPALGLAVLLDPKGRDLLQLVAPAEFEARLRAPLVRAAGTTGR